tara:strand:+ start:1839 stop:2525 length:687 start_codon:yes stop_codon:yes gene_type:complete
MIHKLKLAWLLGVMVFFGYGNNDSIGFPIASTSKLENDFTLSGPKNYLDGWPARTGNGLLHVIVEIPAGTNQKWEVTKSDGKMIWEMKKGKRRIVKYLPYPTNYGMVPRTLLPEQLGGDGDPLDILLLGPAKPRGEVAVGRLIGILKLLDDGERDDKLIAVEVNGPLSRIRNIDQLKMQFRGVVDILETWFVNYKGKGRIESGGFAGIAEAESVLESAIYSWRKKWKR